LINLIHVKWVLAQSKQKICVAPTVIRLAMLFASPNIY